MRIGNDRNRVDKTTRTRSAREAGLRGGFVSRAEGKLAGFMRVAKIDFRAKTVLDIGSSTGGWTELALGRGAKRVIAVELGTRQMKAPLRFDSRVELLEKTNIFEISARGGYRNSGEKGNEKGNGNGNGNGDGNAERLTVAMPDIVMADVSFESLRKVLAHVQAELSRKNTEYLVMLKPQFEAKNSQLVGGVVKNEKIRREIIREFEEWLRQNGFVVVMKRDSEVQGKFGNLERMYWLRLARI